MGVKRRGVNTYLVVAYEKKQDSRELLGILRQLYRQLAVDFAASQSSLHPARSEGGWNLWEMRYGNSFPGGLSFLFASVDHTRWSSSRGECLTVLELFWEISLRDSSVEELLSVAGAGTSADMAATGGAEEDVVSYYSLLRSSLAEVKQKLEDRSSVVPMKKKLATIWDTTVLTDRATFLGFTLYGGGESRIARDPGVLLAARYAGRIASEEAPFSAAAVAEQECEPWESPVAAYRYLLCAAESAEQDGGMRPRKCISSDENVRVR